MHTRVQSKFYFGKVLGDGDEAEQVSPFFSSSASIPVWACRGTASSRSPLLTLLAAAGLSLPRCMGRSATKSCLLKAIYL